MWRMLSNRSFSFEQGDKLPGYTNTTIRSLTKHHIPTGYAGPSSEIQKLTQLLERVISFMVWWLVSLRNWRWLAFISDPRNELWSIFAVAFIWHVVADPVQNIPHKKSIITFVGTMAAWELWGVVQRSPGTCSYFWNVYPNWKCSSFASGCALVLFIMVCIILSLHLNARHTKHYI